MPTEAKTVQMRTHENAAPANESVLDTRKGTQHESAEHEQRRRYEQNVFALHAMPCKHPHPAGNQGNHHSDVCPEDDVGLLSQRDTMDELKERDKDEEAV